MKKIVVCILLSLASLSLLQGQSVTVGRSESLELLNTVWILANGSSDTASYRMVSENFGSFSGHKVVGMLKSFKPEGWAFRKNFENVILPYAALKMNIDKNGNIKFDMNKPEDDKMLSSFWVTVKMNELLLELGDFYNATDFHRYYTSVKEKHWISPVFEFHNGGVDLSKINGILGTDMKTVQFVAPIIRLSKEYGVPFVFVDGRLLPMFYDAESEMQYPSFFAAFNPYAYGSKHIRGLMTAVFVDVTRDADYLSTPDFVYGVLDIMRDFCKECDVQGFQVWNFMSKWVPLLLMDEYYKDDKQRRSLYTAKADDYGFIWHRNALEYMDYYYSNRDKYPAITDFMPQLDGYISYLPEILDDLKTDYEAASHPYVVSVFPSPNSELDMNGENIEIIVNFSRKIQPSSVHIVIKSLYRHKKQDVETNFYMIDDSTLKFSIPVKTARTIGFYGINLKAGSYDNFPVKELDITYFQPDNRKSK